MAEELYVCAFSGVAASEELLVEDGQDDDELEDLPVGWIEISVRRRVRNPEHFAVQAVMAQTVEQMALQIPEDKREEAKIFLGIQVRAQYASLLSTLPPYLTESETVHVSDPAGSKAVSEAYGNVRRSLGLSVEEAPAEEKTA